MSEHAIRRFPDTGGPVAQIGCACGWRDRVPLSQFLTVAGRQREIDHRFEEHVDFREKAKTVFSTPATDGTLDERIARCIIGPREQVPPSLPYTLQELRDVRWNQASEAQRKDALWAARSIIRELGL